MTDYASLTILIPTRNRPNHCASLLRFLARCGVRFPILIADSSDPAEAERLRADCDGIGQYLRFPSDIALIEKLLSALATIRSRYVVMLPDDDVTFPHAIEACLAHLEAHQDFAAAQGYVLDFGIHAGTFDVTRTRWFTPTIGENDPLERLYHLVRRYQPFFWAVFRTGVLTSALEASRICRLIAFQEMTVMNIAVLQGKIARLPIIYSLRGMEESLSILESVDPFFAFLRDSQEFFVSYKTYRDGLADFYRKMAPEDVRPLIQILDVVHATKFSREMDGGVLNHKAQLLLGGALPPIAVAPQWRGWRDQTEGDIIHASRRDNRHYLWRRQVLEAEPSDETYITTEEIDTVEAQLEYYDRQS